MDNLTKEHENRLREFLKLAPDAALLSPDAAPPEVSAEAAAQLAHFNIEWHDIPSNEAVPIDDEYLQRLYPMAPRDFTRAREHTASYREAIVNGHKQHQGRVIGVETTLKPRYLPGNRQSYGTRYGFDTSVDPFAIYLGRAGLVNGTRYAHDYISLRAFLRVVNDDWRARSILPPNYRVTICPPAVFNLIGTIFHTEWSETETLELGFYRDPQGNATCYAVGANAPGDFSYINEVEGESEWTLMGFRLALVPE
jgi:hypothetical protein